MDYINYQDIQNIDMSLLRKKREDETKYNKNGHTKYSDENSRRKIKRMIINELLDFINLKIVEKYNSNIGNGMLKKKLMKINQEQIINTNIEYNQNFLNKNLKDIFSQNISGRITNYPKEQNKILINELINENDVDKKIYFQNLFELTFLDCLKYFRNDEENIKELQGMKKFSDLEKDIEEKEGIDYAKHIFIYLNMYEKLIYKKKPKKRNIIINS